MSGRFLKIQRGGERFWVREIREYDDGSRWVRCDSETSDPRAPRKNIEFLISPDEQILETMVPKMRDHLKVIS